uniref:Reverse transcriptase domain-containing protein n=1 Tax=Tanacetum cinerariifolium TaxID=118510 RepID=A0A6L2LJX6_TANCI|nr:reverse transcriptase domain-containing protein [Tanacetum cinerariifolium]
MFSSETNESLPASPKYDRYPSGDRYHVVPPPHTGTFMPPKSDWPSAPIIEDWVSDSEDDSEAEIPQNSPSFIQPTEQVKPPRLFVKPVENSIPAANLKTDIPKPKSHRNSRNRKAYFVCNSLTHLIKDLNGGYVAFGGNLKGGKISGKDTECLVLSPEFKLPDENQVLLRVLKENNMYNVDLKNIVPSRDLTYLFANATLDESNLWHRRLGHINFKTMNKLVKDLNQLCGMKGIKREFSVPRTPQQNGIAERKNRTLIEAAKTMLSDLLLPIPFWVEAVSTAYYVQNRVLVTKPHNKTPYELLLGKTPSIGFMRPFGCLVTILNTLYPLGKFDGKADEGFLVGYSAINLTLVQVSKNNLMQKKQGGNVQQYALFPLWSFGFKCPQNTDGDAAFEVKGPEFEGKKPESKVHVSPSSGAQTTKHDDKTKREAKGNSPIELSTGYRNLSAEFEDLSDNSINEDNADDSPVPAVGCVIGIGSCVLSIQEGYLRVSLAWDRGKPQGLWYDPRAIDVVFLLAMPSHFHKKFCRGTVFATGRRSFIEPWTRLMMKRTNRRTRVLIGLYPCHIDEKITIKEVKGESVMEWKTKVTTKEGIVIKFPRKFRGYKLVTEEELEENEGLKEIVTQVTANVNNANGEDQNEIEALLVEEFCPSNEMKKLKNEYWNYTMVGANHVAYTDMFHELAKLVPHLVNPKSSRIKRYIHGLAPQIHGMLWATQPTTIQSAILTAGILTDEAVCCGTLTKGNDKRKKMEELSKQRSTWEDNKKAKTGSGFVATVPPKNDNVNTYPKACYECGSLDHLRYDFPKWKQETGQAWNPLALEGNKNTQNNGSQARGKEFNGNDVEALQDPKVVTGTFSLNDQFAIVLFAFGADFSFIFTTFAPLLNVKPCIINPSYLIEIADGMDWLSKNKAVIVCHEKVVEISIKEGGILRVHEEDI